VKAGEAGTYQATWDNHPMAIDGPARLKTLFDQGKAMNPPLIVTPYVIVRGRAEWNTAEWDQIARCAAVTGRVVLNLEPGEAYWNGPTRLIELQSWYLGPLRARLQALAPTARVELCAIPRQWVIDELGGVATLGAWLSAAQSASWECYDAIAPDLDVAKAISRVDGWAAQTGLTRGRHYRIPLVQRSRIQAWANTEYAADGMQVWHLDGD